MKTLTQNSEHLLKLISLLCPIVVAIVLALVVSSPVTLIIGGAIAGVPLTWLYITDIRNRENWLEIARTLFSDIRNKQQSDSDSEQATPLTKLQLFIFEILVTLYIITRVADLVRENLTTLDRFFLSLSASLSVMFGLPALLLLLSLFHPIRRQ